MSDPIRVGGGRLRVDAARAVAKLREYQLPDPTLWTLEVVRGAVLLGATAIHVEADSDDVWIGFQGEPLGDEDLTRLFDDLVSSGGERRAQRLLAIGVNTALALGPRFVDVWSIDDARGARRTRYAPHLLRESSEGTADALRSLVAEVAPRPEQLLGVTRGGAIHVRRALGMETMGRFLRGDVPPEVHRVLSAATSLRVPIHAHPRPVPPSPPLLSLPLGETRAHLRGRVEILPIEQASGPARLEWSELGVTLASDPLVLEPVRDHGRVPIVVRLDFDRLPTNAARSAVRQGETRIDEALADGKTIVKEAIAALARAVVDADPARRPALRAAALAIVHAHLSPIRAWQKDVKAIPESGFLSPLLHVPLVRDALGRDRTLFDLAQRGEEVVYRGVAPVRPELAPWFDGVPWMPVGDPAYALYGESPPKDASQLLAHAERHAAARIRYLEKPEIELSFAADARDLASATFHSAATLPEGTWLPSDALGPQVTEGRIAIQHADVDAPRGEIVILVLRRVIHRMTIPSEIPFRAVITSGIARANPEYTGLVDQDALPRLTRALGWAAVRAAELVAAHLAGEPLPSTDGLSVQAGPALASADAEQLAATLRAAMRLALRLKHEMTHDEAALREMLARPSPLVGAPAFSTSSGDRLSLSALRDAAQEGAVLGTTRPRRGAKPSLAGRLLLAMSDADASALPLLLARPAKKSAKRKKASVDAPIHIVPYGDQLYAPKVTLDDVMRSFARSRALIAEDTGDARAAFAVLGPDEPAPLILSHVGRPVSEPQVLRDAHLPLGLRVDDDRLVPTAAFDGVANPARLSEPLYDVSRWTERLAAALAQHLLGRTPPTLRLGETDRLALFVLLAELVPDASERSEVDRAALDALPILPRVGGGAQSLAFFRLAGASRLPFVTPDVAARILRPLSGLESAALSARSAVALARFFGIAAVDRTEDVAAVLADHERERVWAAFSARPVDRPLAQRESAVSVSGTGITSGFAQPIERTSSVLRITTRSRIVCELRGEQAARALEVQVDVEPELVDIEKLALSDVGTSRVKGAIRDATRRLLEAIATSQPRALASDRAVVDLAQAFIDELPTKRSEPVRRVLDALLDAPGFPMLTGSGSLRSTLREREREAWFAHGLDGWLGPSPGAKANALDEANVLALPDPQVAKTLPWVRLALALLATLAPSRDVTKSARRLREARRVAQSGSGAPTLPPWIDRRFAVSLTVIAQQTSGGDALLEVFPQGEAALVEDGATRLVLVGERGENVHTYAFVPPVFIVARSPFTEELGEPDARARVEEAVRTIVAEILRWTADHVPHAQWSPAIKKAVRGAALLGGATHLDRLAGVEMFPTTSGAFVRYDDLRAQVNRFGNLWVVNDPEITLVPLDPARFALVLAQHEAPLLHAVLPTIDGEQELSLDARARANRARPRWTSIEPTTSEGALGARCIEVEGGHAWVMPLEPRRSGDRATHTSIDLQPLGAIEDLCRWPTLSWVDSTALTPNRVHDAPMRDATLANIERALREASESIVLASFEAPRAGALSVLVDADVSRSVLGDRGSQVRGLLVWGGVGAPETMTVRLVDALNDRDVGLVATPPASLLPRPVPLVGELLVAGSDALTLPETQLDTIARRAYVAMLTEAGGRWRSTKASAEEKELALAALVQGAITLHLGALKERWLSEPLPFLRRGATTLRALMDAIQAKAPRFVLSDRELAVEDQLPANGVVIVDDGTLPARVAIALLPAQSLREWVEQSSAPDEAPAPAPAPPAAPPKKASKKPAATVKPAVTPQAAARAEEVLARRVATLARAVDTNVGAVRVDRAQSTPIVARSGKDIAIAGNHRLVAGLARATDAWSALSPVLAAEVVSVAGSVRELDAIERLLDLLGPE